MAARRLDSYVKRSFQATELRAMKAINGWRGVEDFGRLPSV